MKTPYRVPSVLLARFRSSLPVPTTGKKTKGQWSEIVEPKNDLERIAEMIRETSRDLPVTVNVNNHYEGSAPETIDRLSLLLR